MERCLDTKALVPEISHAVPRHLRERMNIVKAHSLDSKRKELEETSSNCDKEQHSKSKKLRATDPSYTPIVLESASCIGRRISNQPEVVSMRIPGALIIDPHVRKLSESHSLKVSEHAIWLLTVAVKEFALSFISKSISTKEAISMGHVPPHLTCQFGVSEHISEARKTADQSTQLRNKLDSSDLHTLITNLPISFRSLSGTVSRTLFERSIGSAIDSSVVLGGNAFDELKKHIIKNVTPIEPKRPRSDPLTVPPTQILHHDSDHSAQEERKDYNSQPVRGLGRGAKDLASLKAHASTITSRHSRNDVSTLNASIPKPSFSQSPSVAMASAGGDWIRETTPKTQITNIQSSPMGHRSVALRTDALSQQEEVSGKGMLESDALERMSGSSETSDAKSLSQGSLRGKGNGVKNLAAMRARSVTSSSDLAATADDVDCPATEGPSEPDDGIPPSFTATAANNKLKNSDDRVTTDLDGDIVIVNKANNIESAHMKNVLPLSIIDSTITVEACSAVATLPISPSVIEILPRENSKQIEAVSIDASNQTDDSSHSATVNIEVTKTIRESIALPVGETDTSNSIEEALSEQSPITKAATVVKSLSANTNLLVASSANLLLEKSETTTIDAISKTKASDIPALTNNNVNSFKKDTVNSNVALTALDAATIEKGKVGKHVVRHTSADSTLIVESLSASSALPVDANSKTMSDGTAIDTDSLIIEQSHVGATNEE